jgi:DNA polymerase zeta
LEKLDDDGDAGEKEENPWSPPDKKPQNIDVDIDEVMLSSQEMSRMVAIDEQEWAELMGENRAAENEDDHEGHFDEDEDFLSDDGPPPDLQADNITSHASRSDRLDNTMSVLYVLLFAC